MQIRATQYLTSKVHRIADAALGEHASLYFLIVPLNYCAKGQT